MPLYKKFLFAGVFLLAFGFRFYGVNWDQDQHLHPDERFLTMVTGAIDWPDNLYEYFDTSHSPLNPHNRGHDFFVYGTFPVFLTKYAAEILGQADYNGIAITGRQLSALFDLGTVVLIFAIARQFVLPDKKNTDDFLLPCLAMLFYALAVLPIQLAHFFAVETYLTFFLTFSLYLTLKLIRNPEQKRPAVFFLGLFFGLSVASKISAVIFLPVILFALVFPYLKTKKLIASIGSLLLFILAFYFSVRIFQPYLFTDAAWTSFKINPKILENWKQLSRLMKPDSGFPPSIQWFNRTPLLYPLQNLILWGLGLPLGLLSLMAVFYFPLKTAYELLNNKKRSLNLPIFILLVWTLLLFIYQGIQPSMSIRYLHPIYPPLLLLTAIFVADLSGKIITTTLALIFILVAVWPVSFISIYSRSHSRVLASDWIYENLPAGSRLAVEHWDDGLPLTLDENRLNQNYSYLSLPLYDPDTPEKWQNVAGILRQSDYIVLTSNRLWASLTRVPDRFPVTANYYRKLFSGELGFKKIAEITSYPTLPLPGFCLYLVPPQEQYLNLENKNKGNLNLGNCDSYQGIDYSGLVIRDDISDETFTVYDHPKILIFQKVQNLDYFKQVYQ